MSAQRFLDLARRGLRMPIGADLVLRQQSEPERILLDGRKLADVIMTAAERYQTPLAMPIMDLMLEKAFLMDVIGVAESPDVFHFAEVPADAVRDRFSADLHKPLPPRMQAAIAAIEHVVREKDRFVPIGMSIGPVSLMTRLLADPITPIYLAGSNVTAAEDPDVHLVETVLEKATQVVLHWVEAQLKAGATAVFIAEPAANQAYFSPLQLAGGSDVWERFVMVSNRKVANLIAGHGADMLFHCCGELTDGMLQSFGTLRPVMLSLGSSRDLARDAKLVPATTVLYGNLPTKSFYSDDAISLEAVATRTAELVRQMRQVDHPFILGSECDVLSVAGYHETIARKVQVMLTCPA